MKSNSVRAAIKITHELLGDSCEACGSTEGLVLHHRNGDHEDDRFENLQLLCRACHIKTHDLSATPQIQASINIEGIQEYLSRPARQQIATRLAGSLVKKKREEKDSVTRHRTGCKLLSTYMGVHPKTVRRWLQGKMQSCNPYAERLIKLAIEHMPEELAEILYEDIERHVKEVDSFLNLSVHGAARLHSTQSHLGTGGEKPGLLANSGISSETPRAAPATPQEDTA